MITPLNLPRWALPLAILAAAGGLYVWGRHDGREAERSAVLRDTVKAQRDAVTEATKQFERDRSIERDRAESMAQLTETVLTLVTQPPKVVTRYKEVPTHGAASVSCPAGVSADFVLDWNRAADAADPPG